MRVVQVIQLQFFPLLSWYDWHSEWKRADFSYKHISSNPAPLPLNCFPYRPFILFPAILALVVRFIDLKPLSFYTAQTKKTAKSRDNAREETLVFCNQVLSRIVQFVPRLSMHDDNVNMIKCALDLYVQWNLDIKNLYIMESLVYRTIFFTPVIAKYMKKEPQYDETTV